MSSTAQFQVRALVPGLAPAAVGLFFFIFIVLNPLTSLGLALFVLLSLVTVARPTWILYGLIATLPLQGVFVLPYGANIKISELLGCFLILGLLVRFLILREPFVIAWRIAIPLLILLAFVLISTLNTPRFRPDMILNEYMDTGLSRSSPDGRSYITAAWGLYCAMLLFSVSTVLRRTEAIHRTLRWFVWSAAGSAIFGIFQWAYLLETGTLYELPGSTSHLEVIHSVAGGFPRTPSSFSEPSVFANYLYVAIPVTLAVLLRPQLRILGRKTAVFLLVLQLIGLLLSFSVSGYVIFLIVLFFFAYLAGSRVASGRFTLVARGMLFTLIIVLVLFCLLQYVGIYPSDVMEFITQRVTGEADSAQQRFGLARIAWEMAKDHYLTGVGIGNYPFLAPAYTAPHSVMLVQFMVPTPSNLFLLVLAESGIPGLLLFLGFLFNVRRFFSQSLDAVQGTDVGLLQVALYSSMMGIFISFLFLDNLFVNYFWVMLGMAVAINKFSRRGLEQSIESKIAVN